MDHCLTNVSINKMYVLQNYYRLDTLVDNVKQAL